MIIDGIANAGNDLSAYLSKLTLRQKLTASNIANADTPGYKTKDILFQEVLGEASEEVQPQIIEVEGLLVKNDGNNVSVDREARSLAENALRFNFASALLKDELADIRKAIRSDA